MFLQKHPKRTGLFYGFKKKMADTATVCRPVVVDTRPTLQANGSWQGPVVFETEGEVLEEGLVKVPEKAQKPVEGSEDVVAVKINAARALDRFRGQELENSGVGAFMSSSIHAFVCMGGYGCGGV